MIRNRVILFTSYYFATKAETVLIEANQSILLVATPESLHYACGLCILCNSVRLENILGLLAEQQITWSAVYRYEKFSGPYEKLLLENLGENI